MYGQNAIVVNELLGKSWRHVSSPISFKSILCLFLQNHLMSEFTFMEQVPPNSNVSLGVAALQSRGFFPYEYWYWIGVGAMIGFVLLLNICSVLALYFLNRWHLVPNSQ